MANYNSVYRVLVVLTATTRYQYRGGVVTIIVKILEGLEDELQLYFSQCLGHWKI